ncbi:ABC transporter substrate-binding protein [Pararhizobium mangrovi]|uniref:ABC transporter substrate-binding protein n=1 Tax=Pararhizobium mangrovi TaxID=2590452 RepID=UPI001F3237BF|nr:ABC transporter substrate-binding protein [Pararhizobium mangrovi]
MKKKLAFTLTLLAGLSATAMAANAEIRVGFVTSLSGPGASIGTLYDKGMKAAYAYQDEVGGEKIKLIKLDDGSDPAAATQDARKLIQQEKVDVLIGTATAPSTTAMMSVADELHVPFIAVSPVKIKPPKNGHLWGVAVPQTPALMVKVIVDRMAREGIKNTGYIGFSDSWGDLVYEGAKAQEDNGDPKVTSNERFARTDTTVTAQALKVMATNPQAVLDGASATQAALPLLELRKRGYQGPFFGTPAMLNDDFIRVGGDAAEGVQVSAGPVVVTEQLPDDHFSKKIGTKFHEIYHKVNGGDAKDGFSGYSFDGWLIFLAAAEKALDKAKPGTPEFHQALMDAIYDIKDLKGVHAIYNFSQDSAYGVDERSLVVVKLVDGKWVYQP